MTVEAWCGTLSHLHLQSVRSVTWPLRCSEMMTVSLKSSDSWKQSTHSTWSSKTPCAQRGRGWCRPAVSGLKAGLCVVFEGLQFPSEAWTALRWASLCVMENPAFPSSWDKTTSTCLRERKSPLHPSAEHVPHLEFCSNPTWCVCLNLLTWLSGDFERQKIVLSIKARTGEISLLLSTKPRKYKEVAWSLIWTLTPNWIKTPHWNQLFVV